jgi:hypothetical protein
LSRGFAFELPPPPRGNLTVGSSTGEEGQEEKADSSLRRNNRLPGLCSDIGDKGTTCSLDWRVDTAGTAVVEVDVLMLGAGFEGGKTDEIDVLALRRSAGLGITTPSIFDRRTATGGPDVEPDDAPLLVLPCCPGTVAFVPVGDEMKGGDCSRRIVERDPALRPTVLELPFSTAGGVGDVGEDCELLGSCFRETRGLLFGPPVPAGGTVRSVPLLVKRVACLRGVVYTSRRRLP